MLQTSVWLKRHWLAAARQLVEWAKNACGCLPEIVRRSQGAKGFQRLPRRWVMERTFGWFARYRRLSKDCEFQIDTSEDVALIARIQVMVHRLARNGQSAALS
jgi:putative transposase